MKKKTESDQLPVISQNTEGRKLYRMTGASGSIYLGTEDRYPEHDEILALTDEQAEILIAAGLVEAIPSPLPSPALGEGETHEET